MKAWLQRRLYRFLEPEIQAAELQRFRNAQLPADTAEVLRRHGEQLRAEIIDGLRRGRWGLR